MDNANDAYYLLDSSIKKVTGIIENLEQELKTQQNIEVNSYKIASLRWYWTAQMAFYFQNQPNVFNFDLSNSSFYTWRDELDKLAGCHFIVIGSQNQFDENELKKIMNIEKIRYFSLSPFNGIKMVAVEGVMRDKAQLLEVYHRIKNNIKY